MAIARHWTLRQIRLAYERLCERQNRERAGRVADVNAAFSGKAAEKQIGRLLGK